MIDHAELAKSLFLKGYNCAQAVFCAYGDVTGLDIDTAAKLASSFGGGLGRLREVCGAVSGAAMALGMARGYSVPGDDQIKAAHYRAVQAFARRFGEQSGSIICRELLRGVETKPGAEPEPRTADFYKKRPCPELVYRAARILDEMLAETLEESRV